MFLLDVTSLSAIGRGIKSLSIIGNIRDLTIPVMGFIDWSLGYNDFQLSALKPEKMLPKTIYIYKDQQRKLYFNYNNQETEIFSEDIGNDAFNNLKIALSSDMNLNIKTTEALYKFIKTNQLNPGLKYLWNRYVAVPYKNLENIIKKTPIYTLYKASTKSFNNICTVAASETGLRVIGLVAVTGLAVISGGIVPAVGAGAYAASIVISLAQQTYEKVQLNRLIEETKLLEQYAQNHSKQKKLGIAQNIFDKTKEKPAVPAKSWLKSCAKYLSTYALEAGVPIVLAALSPISGLTSAINFGVFIGASAIGVGIGVSFRKQYEDQKLDLKKEIEKIKDSPVVPNYNNLSELKEHIKQQAIQIAAQEKTPYIEPKEQKKSPYWQAFIEVLNPFDPSKKVADPTEFAKRTIMVAGGIIAAATGATLGVGGIQAAEVLMPGLVVTAVATGTTAFLKSSIEPSTAKPIIMIAEPIRQETKEFDFSSLNVDKVKLLSNARRPEDRGEQPTATAKKKSPISEPHIKHKKHHHRKHVIKKEEALWRS